RPRANGGQHGDVRTLVEDAKCSAEFRVEAAVAKERVAQLNMEVAELRRQRIERRNLLLAVEHEDARHVRSPREGRGSEGLFNIWATGMDRRSPLMVPSDGLKGQLQHSPGQSAAPPWVR